MSPSLYSRSGQCRSYILLVAVLVTACSVSQLWGQPGGQPWIYLSDKPNDPNPGESLSIRPNVTQSFFVTIKNPTAMDKEVVLQVWADGKPLPGASWSGKVAMNGRAEASLGKPPAPPEPGTKPAPLTLNPIADATKLELRLFEKDKLDQPPLQVTELVVAPPSNYVKVTGRKFTPANGNNANKLEITLATIDTAFAGPKAKAELVLDPIRIPGLSPKQKPYGTRVGYLRRRGSEVTLTAERIQFDAPTSASERYTLVTVDGYKRAFIVKTAFAEGDESQPIPVVAPMAIMRAPSIAVPDQPYPVVLEVDNAPAGSVLELGVDYDGNTLFEEKNGEIVTFQGSRQIKLQYAVNNKDGALVVHATTSDWKFELDLAGIYGRREIRFRILDKEGGTPVEFYNSEAGKNVSEIRHKLVLDGSPPETVKFVSFPEKLLRGAVLPVKAQVLDEDTGITKVAFYLGKPGPDGKLPPTAEAFEAKLADADQGIWVADIPAPTSLQGRFDLTIQATNGANLVATEPVVIQLVDPPKADDTKKNGGEGGDEGKEEKKDKDLPWISGTVVEGAIPQPGVPVSLIDKDGAVVDATSTDENGKFKFTKVKPGVYQVGSSKVASNTQGSTVVAIKEDEKKEGVEVPLYR